MKKVSPPKPKPQVLPDEEGEETIKKVEGDFDSEDEISEENTPEKIRENNYPPEEE